MSCRASSKTPLGTTERLLPTATAAAFRAFRSFDALHRLRPLDALNAFGTLNSLHSFRTFRTLHAIHPADHIRPIAAPFAPTTPLGLPLLVLANALGRVLQPHVVRILRFVFANLLGRTWQW